MGINEYVRTSNNINNPSFVAKIIKIENKKMIFGGLGLWITFDNKKEGFYENIITKHSKDIIDLIEKKDTLLIYDKEYDDTYKSDVVEDNDKNLCVIDYEYNKIIDLKLELYLGNIEIRGILTREQFEDNAYTIEKERCNCEIIYKTK